MNKKINGLNRTMVYSFLVGLIVGGVIMAVIDSKAKTPLFSEAFFPSDTTLYCGPDGNAEELGYYCGGFNSLQRVPNPQSSGSEETGPYGGGVPILRDRNGNPITPSR